MASPHVETEGELEPARGRRQDTTMISGNSTLAMLIPGDPFTHAVLGIPPSPVQEESVPGCPAARLPGCPLLAPAAARPGSALHRAAGSGPALSPGWRVLGPRAKFGGAAAVHRRHRPPPPPPPPPPPHCRRHRCRYSFLSYWIVLLTMGPAIFLLEAYLTSVYTNEWQNIKSFDREVLICSLPCQLALEHLSL